MIRVASLPSSEPTDSTENGAFDVVSYRPSAAAIHGLDLGHGDLALDVTGDDDAQRRTQAKTAPKRVALRYIGSSPVLACLRISHRPTPMTTAPPTMYAEKMTCGKRHEPAPCW